jgi:hypothetical protein
MKISAVHFVWLLLLAALVFGAVGCASDDPENESVRPWNSPQGWEGTMPIQGQQHGQ